METLFEKAGDLVANMKEYVNNRVSAVKLEAAEKSSKLIAVMIAAAVVALFILLVLVFVGLTAAILLSQWTGSVYAGTLIVAGIFLLLAVLLWFGREKLIRLPVMNAILQQMFKDEKDQQH